MIFFSGEMAQPRPPHPSPSALTAPRPLLTEILNTPLNDDSVNLSDKIKCVEQEALRFFAKSLKITRGLSK